MPTNRRRWWDNHHRKDCTIIMPLAFATGISVCLATGCPIPLWPPMLAIGTLGALTGAVITYLLPSPR